jgi:hypothetical protein
MRALALVAVLSACGGTTSVSGAGATQPAGAGAGQPVSDPNLATHDVFLTEDDVAPSRYGRTDLDRVIAAEHAALDTADAALATLANDPKPDDALAGALADRGVRQRFVATLESCRDSNRRCPPRLEDRPFTYDLASDKDPKLDVPLRFDLEDWRNVTAELNERACACRTLACVDALDAAMNALETRPMPQVSEDDAAATSLTRARACAMRLRGRRS